MDSNHNELQQLKKEIEQLKKAGLRILEAYECQKEILDGYKSLLYLKEQKAPKSSLAETVQSLDINKKIFYQAKMNFLKPDFSNLAILN